MPLHLKAGDGDLLLITGPALLTRCARQSHAINCTALIYIYPALANANQLNLDPLMAKLPWLNDLKGSYDVSKNNIILCIWCNAMCLRGSRFKKHIIFHTLYITVAPLCSAFLKKADFYKAHHSEKHVLWLASYPVCCDWPKLAAFTTKRTASTWHGVSNNNTTYSENKSYAFFHCVYVWAVLCKSSHTVT